jgi:zinc transporter 5/7
VSVEIVFDALHRLREGYELRRLNELLIVSTLGFLVNIVGLTAFGHAHHGHGHDHGHSHGHTHSHSHGHSHSHDRSLGHSNGHTHGHSHAHSNSNEHSHSHKHEDSNGSLGAHRHTNSQDSKSHAAPSLLPPFSASTTHGHHGHDHNNENMQGIFLHILADALGSVAVIISTILTKYNSWHGWDPLASCLIAILIFFSAIPLVKRSGSKLLLSLSDEAEYSCRGVLQGISELRGVQGYAGVRLWMADKDQAGSHGHESHGHNSHHDHQHTHRPGAIHEHGPEPIHEHPHENGKEENPKSPVTILGVIHIVAAPMADINDVRDRVEQYFSSRGMDIVVHVEKEGDARCWCGVGMRNSLGSPLKSTFN